MPEKDEFEAALDQTASFVNGIGDQVDARNVEGIFSATIHGEEYLLDGHRCSSDESIYFIVGHPDMEYLSVIYFLSVSQNVGDQLSDEAIESLVEEDSEDNRNQQEAGEKLLDQSPREEMYAFQSYLYMLISGTSHMTQIHTNDSDSVTAYDTSTLIFPYEPSFNIKELYEGVESVVEAGKRGSRILGRSISVQEDKEDSGEIAISFSPSW